MTRPRVEERIAALVEAARLLGGFASADVRDGIAELDARAGQRRGLGVERTVVALAGSTGSGKSSLFNAVTGLALAETGVRRPTTPEPLACVWGERDAVDLLDWLAVPGRRRIEHRSALDDGPDRLDGLVLLDLPDHDSMVSEHRVEVDRLVGLVDLVVWVTDPVKYADALLHEQYLARLSHHGAVVMVVLNQVDRLSAQEQRACLIDLRRLLARDGLAKATVLATSAVDGSGIDGLRRAIGDAVERRHAATDRLSADAAALTTRLRTEAGLKGWRAGGAIPDGFARVWPLLPVAAVRDDVADRHRAFAAEHLASRGRPSLENAPAAQHAVPDAVTTLLRDHVEQGLTLLPGLWRNDMRQQLAPVVDGVVEAWRVDVRQTSVSPPAPRESWGRLLRTRRLLLGAAVAAGTAAAVLVVLLLTGTEVPVVLWAVSLLVAAGAGAGLAILARWLASEQQAYADDAGRRVEDGLRARVERDIGEYLDAPLVERRRDCDAAVSALATASAD